MCKSELNIFMQEMLKPKDDFSWIVRTDLCRIAVQVQVTYVT